MILALLCGCKTLKANLDVKLVYAEGRIYYQETLILWVTEFETDPVEFLVEASADGKNWKVRGRVGARGGEGITEYKFVDGKDPALKFYRIRTLNSGEGEEVLSEFELENYSIQVELEALILDESSRLVMEYSIDKNQQLMVRIYNRQGEQVLTRVMPAEEAGDYIYHLDVSELEKDYYLLQVSQVMLDKAVAEQAFKLN